MAKNKITPFNVDYTKEYLLNWKKEHHALSMQWISRVIVRRSDRYLETCFTRGTIGVDDLNRICQNTGLDRNKALKVEDIIDIRGDKEKHSDPAPASTDYAALVKEITHINDTLEEMLKFIKEVWK